MTAALVWLIDEIGLVGPVTEKLNEIASGCWDPQSQPLAGSRSQRKCLKVPIARTSFGQNQSILWQIAIGTDVETELPQQEIKGELSALRCRGALICHSVGSVRFIRSKLILGPQLIKINRALVMLTFLRSRKFLTG